MDIPLHKLNYPFSKKPLLIGGKAMEYYGIRKSGRDIDFIAPLKDVIQLITLYPTRVKDLWGDLGVCPFEFEIWSSICYLSYDDVTKDAIEQPDFLIISLEKLLFMKTLGIKKEKYLNDTKLIVEHMLHGMSKKFNEIRSRNEQIVHNIKNVEYIEKTGP